jgi:hypothetical protein
MKISRSLTFALTGWLASAIAVVCVGFLWPSIFPGIVQIQHYYGSGPSLMIIIGMAIILATPGGLIGGLVGSRIPREGGRVEQFIMAAVFGILFGLPLSCLGLWFFTGW